MIEVKTLENCSLMPVESDIWFINQFTDRDYTIMESKKSCQECGCTQYAYNHHEYIYESYCNNCGLIKEREGYINEGVYNGFTHDMKVLKNRSTHLKTIETQIIRIEPDYNKKYRDFKHRYYKLFINIANNDYHIDKSTANDIFYNYFRGFYDLNNRRGLKRENLIKRFLDRISINPREYFMTQAPVKLQKEVLGKDYFKRVDLMEDDDDGNNGQQGASRTPVVSEGQLNVTGKSFTGRKVSYLTYLDINQFTDSPSIRMKYIKRYMEDSVTLLNIKYSFTPEDYDRSSVAEPITPVPTLTRLNNNELSIPLAINNYKTVKHFRKCAYCGSKIFNGDLFCSISCQTLYYNVVDNVPFPISYNPDIYLVGVYNDCLYYYPRINKTNQNPDNETYKYLGDKKYYTRLNHTNNTR